MKLSHVERISVSFGSYIIIESLLEEIVSHYSKKNTHFSFYLSLPHFDTQHHSLPFISPLTNSAVCRDALVSLVLWQLSTRHILFAAAMMCDALILMHMHFTLPTREVMSAAHMVETELKLIQSGYPMTLYGVSAHL